MFHLTLVAAPGGMKQLDKRNLYRLRLNTVGYDRRGAGFDVSSAEREQGSSILHFPPDSL